MLAGERSPSLKTEEVLDLTRLMQLPYALINSHSRAALLQLLAAVEGQTEQITGFSQMSPLFITSSSWWGERIPLKVTKNWSQSFKSLYKRPYQVDIDRVIVSASSWPLRRPCVWGSVRGVCVQPGDERGRHQAGRGLPRVRAAVHRGQPAARSHVQLPTASCQWGRGENNHEYQQHKKSIPRRNVNHPSQQVKLCK